jgi:glycosyltransferase involved in cell wall biosynthesis
MLLDKSVAVIIPALNEAESIAKVLGDIPSCADYIIVCDNGSTDATPSIAQKAGAFVIFAPKRGYGSACLQGIRFLQESDKAYQKNPSQGFPYPDIIAFLDGDYSDYPDELTTLILPIAQGKVHFVLGTRIHSTMDKHAMLPQAYWGNKFAVFLIKLFWNYAYTDLGPFRAISSTALTLLNMQDQDFGWTVEMQIKAAQHKLPFLEIPVRYRKRIGYSKITGTITGTLKASWKILYTIYKYKSG